MKRKVKPKSKPKPKSGKDALTLVNFKARQAEIDALNAMAKKYANGNLSAWLRYAGANCRPPKSALIA